MVLSSCKFDLSSCLESLDAVYQVDNSRIILFSVYVYILKLQSTLSGQLVRKQKKHARGKSWFLQPSHNYTASNICHKVTIAATSFTAALMVR
jgi:hypothetical protein